MLLLAKGLEKRGHAVLSFVRAGSDVSARMQAAQCPVYEFSGRGRSLRSLLGIRQALTDAQAEVDAVASDTAAPSWDNTLGRLDRALEQLSRDLSLSLSVVEMRTIQAHFAALGRPPVDVELETIAHTLPLIRRQQATPSRGR